MQDFCRVLSELHDKAPVHKWEASKAAIETAFGLPVEQMFESIDHSAIASGSIAQVHTQLDPQNAWVSIARVHTQLRIPRRSFVLLVCCSRILERLYTSTGPTEVRKKKEGNSTASGVLTGASVPKSSPRLLPHRMHKWFHCMC